MPQTEFANQSTRTLPTQVVELVFNVRFATK